MVFKKLIYLVALIAPACAPINRTSQPLPAVHLPINDPNLKFLWSRYYPFAAKLVEAPDHIIGLSYTTITSFDSLTGKIMWERTGDYPTELINSNSVLYEATNSELTAIDAQSGNLIWTVNNLKTGNALSLFANSENVFVQHQTGNPIVVLDKTGKIIRLLDISVSMYPLSIDANTLYFINVNGLNAFDIDLNQIDWSVHIDSASQSDSISTENNFYIDSVSSMNNDAIYAIDKSTKSVIWIWDESANFNIISNLCILDEQIYFLTADGFLIGLNKSNGQEITKLEFSNKPFVLYRSKDPQVGEYHIAIDQKNKILFVAFGDSFQLMAIQLLEPTQN